MHEISFSDPNMEPPGNRKYEGTYCKQQTLHQHYRTFRNILHRNPSFINPVYRTKSQSQNVDAHRLTGRNTQLTSQRTQSASVLHKLGLGIQRCVYMLFPKVYAKERDTEDTNSKDTNSKENEAVSMATWNAMNAESESLFPEHNIDMEVLENKIKDHFSKETGMDRLREMYNMSDDR